METATIRETVLPGLVRGVPSAYQDTAMEEIGSLTQTELAELIFFEFDARAWIRNIGVPTLVLCRENDEVENLDSPAEFTRLLEGFLGSVS